MILTSVFQNIIRANKQNQTNQTNQSTNKQSDYGGAIQKGHFILTLAKDIILEYKASPNNPQLVQLNLPDDKITWEFTVKNLGQCTHAWSIHLPAVRSVLMTSLRKL